VTTSSRFSKLAVVATLFLLASAGCGYHTSGKAVRLPANVRTIYVPTFTNKTQAFRVEQVLTSAVVQELRSRTNFQVLVSDTGTADATLRGTVTYVGTSALTYNSQNGNVSSSLLQVGMNVSLVDRSGKVLWENPSYLYREQYELSQDASSFFEEESPAMQRIAHDFALSLVSDIVEAY
jgi:hypothetical protein